MEINGMTDEQIKNENGVAEFGDRTTPFSTGPINHETDGDIIMNTTHADQTATLSELELFKEFLKSKITTFDRFGNEQYTSDVADILEYSGYYTTFELELRDAGDDPSDYLEIVRDELSDMAENIGLALEAFEDFKFKHLLEFEQETPDESDVEAYAAWKKAYDEAEENPRYSLVNNDEEEVDEFKRLEQFAWLINNTGDNRSAVRLKILWDWASEMVYFQSEADRTGKPVEYFQRGEILRTFFPEMTQEAA